MRDVAASGGPALAVRGLCVDVAAADGWARVVDDVSFTVPAGRTVGLVGESGSGKTLTCLAVPQLLPERRARIAAGSVRVDGRELVGLSARQLEDVRGDEVAMVFQEPMTSLNPAFTIGAQITEVVRRHRGASRADATRRAVEVLDDVGIPSARERMRMYPHELSGGMRQRAMIAMALSCEPRVLLADEPTTALDVTVQAQVLDVLRRLSRERDMAVLLVTHDLGVVADLCDDVVVMYAGQVVESADVDGLFEEPAHPYTRALLRAMPQVGARQGELAVIPGTAPGAGELPGGCRFHPRCEAAIDACRAGPVALAEVWGGRASRCIRPVELSGRRGGTAGPEGDE